MVIQPIELECVGNMEGYEITNRVYSENGISSALRASGVGNIMVSSELPLIVASRGRNPENPSDRKDTSNLEQRLEIQSEGIFNTLTSVKKDNYVLQKYRIRKLTPKECFRLMGVKDEDYNKLTVSDSQKYKQAGNSIVVDVLMATRISKQ